MDEMSGTLAADSSGNSYSATLTNSAYFTNGTIGNGIFFPTTNSYAVAKTFTNTLGNFTVSTWVKIPKSLFERSANIMALDKEYIGGFWLGKDASTKWGGGVRQSSAPYGMFVQIRTNTWEFLAMSRSGSVQTIWTNGIFAASQACSATALNTNKLCFGIDVNLTPSAYFTGGLLDDVRIYNRALSSNEVQTIYNWRP